MQDRQRALLTTTFGVLLLSPDALVLRWLSMDAMQILAWRGLLMALGMGCLLGLRLGRRLPHAVARCGWTGLGCALCYGASTVCFVEAMQRAGAANTLLIYSISPLVAGALAWLWLGERMRWYSVLAIVMCMAGVALIVSDQAPEANLAGNLLALLAAILLALNFALARSRPLVDTSPALILGALLSAAIGYAVGGPPQLGASQLAVLVLMAGLVLPAGFILIQRGPRTIGAAEVGLLLLLEIVLGPLWVWLLLDEAPTSTVMLGGAIVLTAMFAHGVLAWTQQSSIRQQ